MEENKDPTTQQPLFNKAAGRVVLPVKIGEITIADITVEIELRPELLQLIAPPSKMVMLAKVAAAGALPNQVTRLVDGYHKAQEEKLRADLLAEAAGASTTRFGIVYKVHAMIKSLSPGKVWMAAAMVKGAVPSTQTKEDGNYTREPSLKSISRAKRLLATLNKTLDLTLAFGELRLPDPDLDLPKLPGDGRCDAKFVSTENRCTFKAKRKLDGYHLCDKHHKVAMETRIACNLIATELGRANLFDHTSGEKLNGRKL